MLITQTPKSVTLVLPLLALLHSQLPAYLLHQYRDTFVIHSGSDEGASVTHRNENLKERCAE